MQPICEILIFASIVAWQHLPEMDIRMTSPTGFSHPDFLPLSLQGNGWDGLRRADNIEVFHISNPYLETVGRGGST